MALVIKTTGVEDYLDDQGEAHVKVLIMGDASAGKTRSASAYPKPIFADCDKGMMSVADRGVPYATIGSSADMDALLRTLETECKTRRSAERRYQTLVIDSLDFYQRIVIQEICKANKCEALSGWRDWGQLDTKMTTLVARLQALPMNIVVNLHIKATKGDDDGPMVLGPKLKGDLKDQIAAEFDLVGHMATFWEAEGGERVLKRAVKWHPEPYFPILKDRSGQLPRFTPVDFTENDYLGLFTLMFGGDHFEELPVATELERLATEEDTEVEPPREGGPVTMPRATGTKVPTQRKPKVSKAGVPTPATKAAPAQPAGQAPEADGNARCDEAGTDTPDTDGVNGAQARELVAQALGGRVVSTETEAEAPSTPPLVCGTPARNATDPVAGCGTDLNLMPEAKDLVNIALIKTKTYLCPDCLKSWRTAQKK